MRRAGRDTEDEYSTGPTTTPCAVDRHRTLDSRRRRHDGQLHTVRRCRRTIAFFAGADRVAATGHYAPINTGPAMH